MLIFFDDILICSLTELEHRDHKNKCSFGQIKIVYVGHIISKKGVHVDESMLSAMRVDPSCRGCVLVNRALLYKD